MRWTFWIFVILWGLSLVSLALGTFGWFDVPRDPLSFWLLPLLGLPWNLLPGRVGMSGPWVAMLAPGMNAAILYALGSRRHGVA